MTEDTKQFIIKVLVVGVVIVALYFLFSPYRNCTRAFTDSSSVSVMAGCIEETSW
jgi:hypothetical protein